MARQVFYVVKDKDVVLAEPFLFLKNAMDFVKEVFKAHGEAGQAYWDGTRETDTHMECRSAHRVLTIDEV